MLLTKEVNLQINGRNVKHLEEKGYLIPKILDNRGRYVTPKGTYLNVKVNDLTKGSHAKVEVSCDYCNKIIKTTYKEYIRRHDEFLGDCCHQCENIKYKQTMLKKYGVENPFEVDDFIEKARNTNLRKYGKEWHMQRPEYQIYLEKVMQERYDVKRPLQCEEFKEKFINTMSTKDTFTSIPQKKVYDLLNELYENCVILEHPCGKCLLDCFLKINDIKIDIEYDGLFWHKNQENRDRKRDYYVLNQGYKILRIKGNEKDEIPKKETLREKIDLLLKSDKVYEKIIM